MEGAWGSAMAALMTMERNSFVADVGGDDDSETLRAAGAASVERRGPANADTRGDCALERIVVMERARDVYCLSTREEQD